MDEVTGTIVRSGDTLVVAFSNDLPVGLAEQSRAALDERMPGVEIVFIYNVAGLAIYRSGV
jgi:hypothetical protein